MKRYFSFLFIAFLFVSSVVFGQKDMQPTPELRKFSQAGWKIQHAHYSFDSLSIYLSAREPGKVDYDLYVTYSRAGSWSTPERLSDQVNSEVDELWPSISSDEQKLFFIRRTIDSKLYKSSHGAQGLYDQLYMAESFRGEWQKAEPVIISSGSDLSPLVMPDNRTVFFARKQMDKKRSYYALFQTRYMGWSIWTLPVRVDSTERRSLYGPYLKQLTDTVMQLTEAQQVERDKKEFDTLYLNRSIPIPPTMRCKPYAVLSGTVRDENTGRPAEANIRLYDAITANLLDEALANTTNGRFRLALHHGIKYNIDITGPNFSHYYATIDCRDSLADHHMDVQIARNLNIRINPFDAELFTPEPPEREVIRNVTTDKTLRVRTKREALGRSYELPIGETYAVTLYRRGYQDTTLMINTMRDVRFSSAELDVPLQPIKVPLVLQLGDTVGGVEIKEGTIRLRNRTKHEVIEMPYTPPTTTIMIRQEDEYEMVIQSPGHFFFDTIVSIPDGYDQQLCNVDLKPIQKNMVVQLRNIQFESNSYILTRSSYAELEKVIKLLEANPQLHIELSAHTDDVGTDAYNDQLSSKRGEATLEYIVKKGIDRSRLTSIGYGKRRPLVPNDSDSNRAINRRVEFKVTEF